MSAAILRPICNQILQSISLSTVGQSELDSLVKDALQQVEGKSTPDMRRSQWEYLVKNEVMKHAMSEHKALKEKDASYYSRMRVLLDLALTLSEQGAVEAQFPFFILQDVFEMQTVASCSHIFSWLEERAPRMTADMVPSRGKALTLIRMLNDLLRRLSRTGSTTILCGRIQTLLAVVYPLGERSGVNLRGQYGAPWEGVEDPRLRKKEKRETTGEGEKTDADAGAVKAESAGEVAEAEDKMQVDGDNKDKTKEEEDRKAEFYMAFWGLQLPFSDPKVFTQVGAFQKFKESVSKVLPALKEANAKEKAMLGSKGNNASGQKRKREPESSEESTTTEYFFAKLLTSPKLLDLEIADVHFRRQILFQLVILLQFISTFTKAAKETWMNPRNRSLSFDFTLEPDDSKWVQETISKVFDEFKNTIPNGRTMLETVSVVLEREKNWVRWKNELCPPFDQEPWSETVDGKKIGLVDATSARRIQMMGPPEEWEHKFGSKALTTIWQMGFADLFDLQINPSQTSLEQFLKMIKMEDAKIEMRRKQLKPVEPEREATPPVKQSEPEDVVMQPPQEETPKSETKIEAPKPVVPSSSTAPASSSLHPSLPPKPGSSPLAASTSTESTAHLNPQAAAFVPKVSTPVPASTAPTPAPKPKPKSKPKAPTDGFIASCEERQQRYSWLALRSARDQHLHLFTKSGSVEELVQAIEAEKNPRPSVEPDISMNASADGESPARTTPKTGSETNGGGAVDVPMEEAKEDAESSNDAPVVKVEDEVKTDEATNEPPKAEEAMAES